MNDKVIEVSFNRSQGAEDVFRCRETGNYYVRQPANVKGFVHWLTANKWSQGFEASCPIRSGVTMRVIDRYGNLLFEEILETIVEEDDTIARKIGEFMGEAVKKEIEKFRSEYGKPLKSHNEWRDWLLAEKEKRESKGYDENWLYCSYEKTDEDEIGCVYTYGKPIRFVKTKCEHKICKKKWTEILAMDEWREVCLGEVGYLFR